MICNGVLVSVIIPLYNRENTIRRAVDSILNQTYTNIEVLVVDDGSIDHSVQMLDKYIDDDRVKVFCQKQNRGANAARNRGIREAKGEYIAFHDSDDAWVPDKLEKQLKCMETENYDVCFSSFKRFFTNSSQIVPDISVHDEYSADIYDPGDSFEYMQENVDDNIEEHIENDSYIDLSDSSGVDLYEELLKSLILVLLMNHW